MLLNRTPGNPPSRPHKFHRRAAAAVVTLTALVGAACGGSGDETDRAAGGDRPYYEGKTITIIVPTEAGGTVDTTTRFLAAHLPKHIEGNPTFVIENISGGNQIVGANEFALKRDHDGTQMFANGNGTTIIQMFGHPQKKFDYGDFEPLVAFGGTNVMFGRSDAGIDDIADLRDRDEPPAFAGISASGTSLAPLLSLELLGVDYEPILGYTNLQPALLALRQGEVDLHADSVQVASRDLAAELDSGEIVPLYSYGPLDESGEPARDPMMEDVMSVPEAYAALHDGATIPDDEAYRAFKLVLASRALSTTLWNFNDAPEEALTALADGIESMVADPDFIAELDTAVGGNEPLIGDQIDPLVEFVLTPEPSTVEWIREWLLENFQEDI